MTYATSHVELAWAAGFFDGEGTTCLTHHWRQPGSPQLKLSIGQIGTEALERFQRAVGGFGRIYQVRRDESFHWAVGRFEHVQAIVAMLWPFLSGPKRSQAALAIREFHSTPRRPRHYVVT